MSEGTGPGDGKVLCLVAQAIRTMPEMVPAEGDNLTQERSQMAQ
jgi:hypothetical protein